MYVHTYHSYVSDVLFCLFHTNPGLALVQDELPEKNE